VASFYAIEYHGRIALANSHGCYYLLLLVGTFILSKNLVDPCRYYPIGLFRNAIPDGQVTERGGLMFLLIWGFMIFTSTFTDMIIAGVESAETGGNIAQLMFSLTLIFNGVLAGPSALPGFWSKYLVQQQLIHQANNRSLHVPSITLHLPSGRHALYRSRQHCRPMLRHRIPEFQPCPWHELQHIS
jgi:ABC-2 type transporter